MYLELKQLNIYCRWETSGGQIMTSVVVVYGAAIEHHQITHDEDTRLVC